VRKQKAAKVKRGPGRPRHDPSAVKAPITVWLTPAEIKRLADLGGGSAQEGIRRLARDSLVASGEPPKEK
jgi:hypothetical protein